MEKLLLALGAFALIGATLFMTQSEQTDLKLNNLGAIDPQVVDLYVDWKQKYNKKYASPDQEWYRLTVFNSNYQMIKEFYEGPEQTYTLDFNQFMDITTEEFAETYLTLRVPESVNQDVDVSMNGNVNAVDWTNVDGVVPPVKNQAQCGSCWAFSAVGAMETLARINGAGRDFNLSEQNLVDCSGSYGNYGCNGGLMDSAFEYVMSNGLASGRDYAYTARDGKCNTSVARNFKIASHTKVNGCDDMVTKVQQQPISVAVDASKWSYYSGGVFNGCGTTLNHGVLLVGVDSEGNWKIRNSWGSGWGEQGHIRLSTGNTCGVCQMASFPNA